jgi:hypothetical protein
MIRYLLRSINVLNLLLGAVLLLVVGYLLVPLSRANTLPLVQKAKPAAKQPAPQPTAEEPQSAAADYVIISERNLFHPERIIPVEKKAEPPLPKPDFVLYGTLIDGETKIAFMDDLKASYTTPGRGKRQHVIAQGGNLSGFVLSEVHNKTVVMARGEEKITVLLEDKLNKRSGPVETTVSAKPAAGTQPQQASRTPQAGAAQPAGQPAASAQAQPYRQFQPQPLNRGVRSIKQQARRAKIASPPASENGDE